MLFTNSQNFVRLGFEKKAFEMSSFQSSLQEVRHYIKRFPLICIYRIYSNKRRGTYLIFRAISAALIRGRRLFE